MAVEAARAGAGVEPGRKYGPIDWLGGWRTCLVGCTVFLAVAVLIRIWQQYTALDAGLDSSSQAFTNEYRTLFVAEVAAVTIGTLSWWSYLVRKGREVVKVKASPEAIFQEGWLLCDAGDNRAPGGPPRGVRTTQGR